MTSFLVLHGRKLDPMQADGNCLYRALSKQLANDPEKHSILRAILAKFATCNVELFKSWVTSTPREILQKTREVRLKEHLDAVSKVGSWGTQLELVAAATLFKVGIYGATILWSRVSADGPDSLLCRAPYRFPQNLHRADFTSWQHIGDRI